MIITRQCVKCLVDTFSPKLVECRTWCTVRETDNDSNQYLPLLSQSLLFTHVIVFTYAASGFYIELMVCYIYRRSPPPLPFPPQPRLFLPQISTLTTQQHSISPAGVPGRFTPVYTFTPELEIAVLNCVYFYVLKLVGCIPRAERAEDEFLKFEFIKLCARQAVSPSAYL